MTVHTGMHCLSNIWCAIGELGICQGVRKLSRPLITSTDPVSMGYVEAFI